ncbi:hypothetical protein FQZ97_1055890 [compost metagenome]
MTGDRFVDATHLRGATGGPLQAHQTQATQDEQKGQRHDEAGQPGAQHDLGIHPTQRHAHGDGQQDRNAQGQLQHGQRRAKNQPGKGHHRAHRQIEFAANHQQRGAQGQDAQLRGRGHEVDEAGHGEHRRVCGEHKEQHDHHQPGNGAQLGAPQQAGQRRYGFEALVRERGGV